MNINNSARRGNSLKYYIDNKEDVGKRIDKYLSEKDENFTRAYVQKLIDDKKVLVNLKIIKASYKLKYMDEIDVEEIATETRDILAQDIKLDIMYEDLDIIIINKAKGMVVHPGNGNHTNTLVNALMYSHKDNLSQISGVIRPGIVHRIDKNTTGIIVVAKNDKAHKTLSEDFKKHDITRKYIALVKGVIQKENIDIELPIGRDISDRKKMCITTKNSKEAITHIKVIERFLFSGYTLIEATLETGRTHQIRVHMAYIGNPVVGDTTYGSKKNEFNTEGQLLHAAVLGIKKPETGIYMEFNKEIPKEFEDILNKLREKEKSCKQ